MRSSWSRLLATRHLVIAWWLLGVTGQLESSPISSKPFAFDWQSICQVRHSQFIHQNLRWALYLYGARRLVGGMRQDCRVLRMPVHSLHLPWRPPCEISRNKSYGNVASCTWTRPLTFAVDPWNIVVYRNFTTSNFPLALNLYNFQVLSTEHLWSRHQYVFPLL